MPLLYPLAARDREFLVAALREWGGPCHLTAELAHALGCADAASLARKTGALADLIAAGTPLDYELWRQALAAAEIAFASDTWGSGLDWESTTGIPDQAALASLRRVQRLLSDTHRPE